MMTESSILDAFFEECEDLLTALTEGLGDMLEGNADDETVNAVFRAVHSIKGAAGAFAMDELVGFAHKFETVLDEVRAGRLNSDEPLLRVLQRAGDVLADLVDAARDGTPANRQQVDPVLDDLQSFLGDEAPVEAEFVFDALTLDFGTYDTGTTYSCSFQPSGEFYATGNDPLLLFQALSDLGKLSVTCDRTRLPDEVSDFDADQGYLRWHFDVADQKNDLGIREVFEFVDDICALEITEKVDDADLVDLSAFEPSTEAGSFDEGPILEAGSPSTTSPPENEAGPAIPVTAKIDTVRKKSGTTLRVDPERVDRLINAVGELIINQSVISQRIQEAALPTSSEVFSDLDDYKLLAREIQEGVMAIRAQPVKPLFQRMLRIAREAADATGKSVVVLTEGEGTEVDKIMVERLADPLTHMIRNAIDHGIESPQKRALTDKPAVGTLKLSASQRSGSIVIEIMDDGAGLNRPRIKQIAVEKGLIPVDAQLSDQEIDHLLFAPGFSTATEITNLSGRGVGMDVVKTSITELGGKITISSTEGRGTTFSIALPLTLAVMDGMVINVGGQTMVVPIASILETIRPSKSDMAQIGLRNQLVRIRGEYIPIVDLAECLGGLRDDKAFGDKVLLLIQTETVPQCALAVDEIFDQRQVVIKSMQGNYGSIDGISGATILGDGKIALIIDPEAIVTMTPQPPSRIPLTGEETAYVH